MRYALALAALAFVPYVHAAELLCTGTGYLRIGEDIPHTALVNVDSSAGTIRVKTFSGWATGPLGNDPQTYMGTLSTENGISYWYNLDRYTGAAIWGLAEPIEKRRPIEFTGKCVSARPLF